MPKCFRSTVADAMLQRHKSTMIETFRASLAYLTPYLSRSPRLTTKKTKIWGALKRCLPGFAHSTLTRLNDGSPSVDVSSVVGYDRDVSSVSTSSDVLFVESSSVESNVVSNVL